MKTIGKFQINWDGIKSVILHSAWVAGLTIAVYVLGLLSHHDFGLYQPVAVWAIGTAGAFLKKFCEEYNVPSNY